MNEDPYALIDRFVDGEVDMPSVPIPAKTGRIGKQFLRELRDRGHTHPDLINPVAADPLGCSQGLLMEWWFEDGDCPYLSLELTKIGVMTGLTDPSGDCGSNDNMTVRETPAGCSPEEAVDFFEHLTSKYLNIE